MKYIDKEDLAGPNVLFVEAFGMCAAVALECYGLSIPFKSLVKGSVGVQGYFVDIAAKQIKA